MSVFIKKREKKQIQITSQVHGKFTKEKKTNNNLTESAQI